MLILWWIIYYAIGVKLCFYMAYHSFSYTGFDLSKEAKTRSDKAALIQAESIKYLSWIGMIMISIANMLAGIPMGFRCK